MKGNPDSGVGQVQISHDVTPPNAFLPDIMPLLPENQNPSEVEYKFSPLALVLLMGDSWPDDWQS